MIKILHVTGALNRSGTETFIMNVLKHLDRTKIIFDFLLYDKTDGGYEDEARALGANIFYYSPRRNGLIKYEKSLKAFFEQHRGEYQAIHYNANSFSEDLPVKMAKNYGIPIRIMHSHNSKTVGFHNIILHKLHRKRLHTFATHFLACSEAAKEWGFGHSKAYKNSVVIPNGIDLSQYSYNPVDRAEIRKEFAIPDNSFVVCHTGTFRAVKNHPFLIEIFKEIHKRRPDATLLLCGAGGDEEKIRRLVDEKGLTDSIKFIGLRTDVYKILSASDSYVFPSFYEGLPFALVEAQTSGIPVFSSDNVPQDIRLTDSLTFLSLDLTAEIWAEKILAWDYSGRATGSNEALKRYDIKNTCKLLTEIYTNGQT